MIDLSKTFSIPFEYQGERIDIVLAKLLPDYSRSQLSNWLKKGRITVNQQSLKPKDKVMGGEEICINIDLSSLENKIEANHAEAIPLNILYEDDELLIIDKPQGFIVHPGAGNREHTLVNALLYHYPPAQYLPRAGIIHRLDKDTTGLLVVAKTLESHTHLIRQMQEREIKRHYYALVQGHIIAGGKIDTLYGRHPKNRLKMAVCKEGRPATTLYSIKKHYHDYTLLNLELLTGRTHQIRVHLAHINHAIVGDPLYGARMRFPAEASEEFLTFLQGFKRQALHAASLALTHPKSGTKLTFNAPLPADFQQLLDLLDAHYA